MKTIKDYRIAFWNEVVKAFNNEAKRHINFKGYNASQPSQGGFSVTDKERTVVISIYIDPENWDGKFAVLDGMYQLMAKLDQRNEPKMIAQFLWNRLNPSRRANVPSKYLK